MKTGKTMNRTWNAVIKKAQKDKMFLNKLLSHPRETLETEMNIKLPAGMKVNVHQEESDSLHLVIPRTLPEMHKNLDNLEKKSKSFKATFKALYANSSEQAVYASSPEKSIYASKL